MLLKSIEYFFYLHIFSSKISKMLSLISFPYLLITSAKCTYALAVHSVTYFYTSFWYYYEVMR